MAGMKFKSFPLMGTWVFTSFFLALFFWNSVVHDMLSGLLLPTVGLAILVSLCVNAVMALAVRTKAQLKRLVIVAVSVTLIIPVTIFGGKIREQIILLSLPGFPRMVDQQAAQTPDFDHMGDGFFHSQTQRFVSVDIPTGWRRLFWNRAAVFRHKDESLEVIYSADDVLFISRELIYCSNDDPESFSELRGFKRIAPKWYTITWYR